MSHNPFEELNARLERIEQLLTALCIPEIESLPDKLMTTSQICKFLDITEPTLISQKKKKAIPFLEIGGSVRFDKAKVIKALEKKSNQNG